MIQSQGHSAIFRAQGEDRTANMPVTAAARDGSGPSFASMVGEGDAASATTASTALRNDPEARSAALSLDVTRPASSGGDSDSTGTAKHGGFWDFIVGIFDMLNPLEHIPVISTIYAKITGHKISPVARLAGDTLYGGPIGAAVGAANIISEKKTGKDIGENVMAMFSPKHKNSAPDDAAQVQMAVAAAPKAEIVWNTPTAAPAAMAVANAEPATATRVTPDKAAGAAPVIPDADKNAHVALLAPAGNIQRHFRTGNFSASAVMPSRVLRPGVKQPPVVISPGAISPVAISSSPAAAPASPGKEVVPVAAPASPAPAALGAALVSQEAPDAVPGNQPVPPQLIAQKMMSSLDQYAAMKKGNMSFVPGFSAAY